MSMMMMITKHDQTDSCQLSIHSAA